MGQGQGSVTVNQRKEPVPTPGPPFLLTSANNGLSVDPVSGKIVLGQDIGAVGDPAQLLSSRDIPMNGNAFRLLDAAEGAFYDFQTQSATLQASNSFNGNIGAVAIGGDPVAGDIDLSAIWGANADNIFLSLKNDGPGGGNQFIQGTFNGNVFFLLDFLNSTYQMGDLGGVNDGSSLIINDIHGNSAVFLFAGANSNNAHLQLDDLAKILDIANTSNDMTVQINGQPGFTGTVTPVNSITVVGGIVTAVT
jgi:hypothetical protein